MAATRVRGVLKGAFLAALAAGGAAVALTGAQPPGGGPAGVARGRAAVQMEAVGILDAFAPPPGAMALHSDPTRSAPSDPVPVAGGVDLHRFFLVAGEPRGLIESISYQRALPVIVGGGNAAAPASANEIYDLRRGDGVAGRLEIQATRLVGGLSALRVDAQAWRAPPRIFNRHHNPFPPAQAASLGSGARIGG